MTTRKIKYGTKDLDKEYGPMTFSRLLETHRLCEEMTQTEMADFLGISKQSLCDLEKGRRIPSPERAAKIAEKLGMRPEHFIEVALQDTLRKGFHTNEYAVQITKVKKTA